MRAENLIATLADPPSWLRDFVAHLAARYCPGRATTMITTLGRLLTDEHSNRPQALLERARRPGRSMGSLARALEDFFVHRGMALPTDQAERLAAGRRQRRVQAVPHPLRPVVVSFAASMLNDRERARRAGTRPRSDQTIEIALGTVRDLAQFLHGRGKNDWAVVDVHDLEAFLATRPRSRPRRLTVLRRFFRFTRAQKVTLVDTSRALSAKTAKALLGQTLTVQRQRDLFRRWTTQATEDAVHPHEALFGMLALLHGASTREVRLLRRDDIDGRNRLVRLGDRPHPVPLDPATWAVLQRCLAHQHEQRTDNPHVIVTRLTKAGRRPASTAYFSHLLDPAAVSPRQVRGTRLADLVNTMDPKLVAAAFGMRSEGVMIYLAGQVDPDRLTDTRTLEPVG